MPRRNHLLAAALLALDLLATASSVFAAADRPATYSIRMDEVRIPLPDGVRLAADLYMPAGGADGERHPVLLEYLPYRKTEARSRNYPLYSYFVERGYVVAAVDIRGTGNSEGRLIPYEYSDIEQQDGEAVIDWLSKQPWSNGNVGHVRHLVGRVQLDPDGAAQPSGAQGDHRRRCDGRPLPGGRALHRRHHSRRFLGDEPGPRQRAARRTGLS